MVMGAKWFSCSGLGFFVGVGLMLAGIGLSRWNRGRVLGFSYRFLLVLGAGLVGLAATPLPGWAYGLWAAAAAAWLIGQWRLNDSRPRLVWALRWVALAACLGAVAAELPYQWTPTVPLGEQQRLYVIGDSLSAGEPGDRFPLWPEIVRRDRHADTVSLARGGATVASALRQADGVVGGDCVVLLEIGGNDLLDFTSGADFADGLDRLLAKVSGPGRRVVLLELPGVPGRNDIGLAQRQLAARHAAVLVPKWLMADVIAGPGNTREDGLHLSARGQQAMADAVWNLFREPAEAR
jgi:acyl-CoA thioesterase-1